MDGQFTCPGPGDVWFTMPAVMARRGGSMANPGDQDPDRTQLLATHAPGAMPARDGDLPHGLRLGRYRIESLLGRGGMGEVYRAEQIEPVRRTVALKLLRGQALDPRRKAHFEIERQVLAQMRHPAIAQIHDADTTPDGHPFFVMEFIDGQPITAYCQSRALPLRARLALFIEVCEGVQHAHQKGVIHRDLKPGNLLVDDSEGRARPKIIDFGIATAAARAGTREVAGTPDYMSPEQAAGDQVVLDTRSDVYSLGVVLCELLSGQRPRVRGETVSTQPHTASLPSAQIAALTVDQRARLARAQGTRPDAMQRVLRRELDWVVARAMAFERGDRYPSAAALAEDLRRFLDGRPLHAVPHSRGYALRKFAGRHRAGLAAGVVATLALVGGLALSVHGLMQARAQRAIAEQRSAELEKVVAFQQSTLEGIDIEAMGAGMGAALRSQLDRAEPADASAAERALARASTADIARELIEGHILAGAEEAIDGDFGDQPGLAGDLRQAVARVRFALGLYEEAARGFAAVADERAAVLGPAHRRTLEAREGQALSLLRAGQAARVRDLLGPLLPGLDSMPPTDELRVKLELEHSEALAALGERPRALEIQQALYERLRAGRGEQDPLTLRVLNNVAINHGATGDPATAVGLFRELLAIYQRRYDEDHEDTRRAMGNLAAFLADAGQFREASEINRRLAGVHTRLLGSDHPLTLSNRSNLATDLMELGELDEAGRELHAVIEARARVLGPEHPQTLRSELGLASLLARLGRAAEAEAQFRKVLALRTRILGPGHPDTITVQLRLAGLLAGTGRTPQALALLQPVWERLSASPEGAAQAQRVAAQLEELRRGDAIAAASHPL